MSYGGVTALEFLCQFTCGTPGMSQNQLQEALLMDCSWPLRPWLVLQGKVSVLELPEL